MFLLIYHVGLHDRFQYDLSMNMISVFFLAWILNSGDAFSDFPSLMSTNASMGMDDSLLLFCILYHF